MTDPTNWMTKEMEGFRMLIGWSVPKVKCDVDARSLSRQGLHKQKAVYSKCPEDKAFIRSS